MVRRVDREFDILPFLKMQILLRGIVKKSLTPQVHKRHDLTYISSADDVTGIKPKAIFKKGKGKNSPSKSTPT